MSKKVHVYAKAEDWAAGMASDTQAFEEIALDVKAEIKRRASREADTGAFADSIKITEDRYKSVRDRVVYSDDPGAFAIERGYRRQKKDGSIVNVPGKFIFRDVIDRGL